MVAILLISVVIIVAVVGWWMSLATSPTTPAVESADTGSASNGSAGRRVGVDHLPRRHRYRRGSPGPDLAGRRRDVLAGRVVPLRSHREPRHRASSASVR